jgi:hypothetical protein
MTRFFERLSNLLAAVAFAEEGDAETARRLAAEGEEPEPKPRERQQPKAARPAAPHQAALSGRRGA